MAVHAPQRHDSEEVSCDEAGTDDQTIPAPAGYAYIGNWILNSTRGDDRFKDYDDVESLLLPAGGGHGRAGRGLAGRGGASRAFAEGGIHEAIMEYENNVFFDILAEDLARRDMEDASIDQNNYEELSSRIDAYIAEFEQHGTDNILVDSDQL